jgi:hypothetical protein
VTRKPVYSQVHLPSLAPLLLPSSHGRMMHGLAEYSAVSWQHSTWLKPPRDEANKRQNIGLKPAETATLFWRNRGVCWRKPILFCTKRTKRTIFYSFIFSVLTLYVRIFHTSLLPIRTKRTKFQSTKRNTAASNDRTVGFFENKMTVSCLTFGRCTENVTCFCRCDFRRLKEGTEQRETRSRIGQPKSEDLHCTTKQ